MLFGTTWENGDLGTPRSSDREQNSPVVGEERWVTMARLPRRQRGYGPGRPAILGNAPDPAGRGPEEELPALGPGESPWGRGRFTELCRFSAVRRYPQDKGAAGGIGQGLSVGGENRLVAALAAHKEAGIEAREVPNEELGNGLIDGAADENHTPSISAHGKRGARVLVEPLPLGKVHREPTELSLSHGAHPPGRQPGQNDETRPNEMGDSAPRLDLGSGRFGRAKQPEKNFDVANRLPPLSRRLRERSRDHGLEKRR